MRKIIKDRERESSDNGFSLLELVVAVSIMLILAVVGFIAYQGLTDNARDAAVESAASQTLTAAIAADNLPGNSVEEFEKVFSSYNESSDGITTSYEGSSEELTVTAVDENGHQAEATAPGNYTYLSSGAEESNTDDADLSFLENPNILPAGIETIEGCTPGDIKQRARIYADEITKRGNMYQDAHVAGISGEEAWKWQSSISGAEVGSGGVSFEDPECGTFVASAAWSITSSAVTFESVGIIAPQDMIFYLVNTADGHTVESISLGSAYIEIGAEEL